MSNYIVFKVSFDGNTHRFSLEKESITIEKLNDTLVSIFGKAVLRCNLRYEDNDGDIITLKSDFDLKEAINVFSDSEKVVIRLQLTPRQRRAYRRNLFVKNDEEEKESSDGGSSGDDIKVDGFKRFGEKFETYIKDFLESLNNGDAKKYVESLPQKGFIKKFLRRGGFTHPFFHKHAPQESNESNEETETTGNVGNARNEFFRRCCGRARWGEIEIGTSQVGTKKWKIKNHLSNPWPAGSILTYCGGDKLTFEKGFTLEKEVLPREEVEIEVSFIAPSTPGKYSSFFRFTTPENVVIGRRLRVLLNVKEMEELNQEKEQAQEEEVCIVEDVKVENSPQPEQEQSTQTEPEQTSQPEQEQQQPEEVKEERGPYSDVIDQLNAMGFTDDSLSLRLLEKYGGDLMAAVDKLLSWQ